MCCTFCAVSEHFFIEKLEWTHRHSEGDLFMQGDVRSV